MAAQWNKYAPTAARGHGRPGRELRPKSITIDIHSHVAIPAAAAFVKPHLDPTTIPLTHFADAGTKALNQKQEEDIRARITGYDERLPTWTPWDWTCSWSFRRRTSAFTWCRSKSP